MRMFRMFALSWAVLFAFLPALVAQPEVQRVEPPNWWVGMHHPEVQVMLYGPGIAHYEPAVDYAGVALERSVRTTNPNYLFLYLRIAPEAQPGTVLIRFRENGKEVGAQPWELWARTPGAADRKGFDQTDVMYLITPDRFANGDTANDYVEGMKERPNRAEPFGRHGGDIAGIRQHLDYIHDMGFTAIWLNPLLENDMPSYSYHGYSTTDFYRVDPRFGTNEDYRALADEARARGIGLIMDMIVNHCGLEHWWMHDLPAADWINQWPEYTETNHRKTLMQDPHASERDRKIFTDGWFVPTMPDLNQRNPLLADYLIQNAIWWIEYLGLAGIRMDTYPYPDKYFMTEWTRRVMEEYPHFNVVGEEWFEWPAIVAYWQRGKKNPDGYVSYLPSLMDFPLQAAMSRALTHEESWGKGWIELYEMLAQDFLYADPDELVVFPDNHDMNRIFAQVGEDYDLWRMAMVYTLTTRGIPQLYYGTEILMSNPGNGNHGLIRADFPGGWPGDTINGFTGEGLSPRQLEAKAFLRRLLHWRQTATAVHHGRLMHFEPKDGVYVFFRYDDHQLVMVAMSKNDEPYTLDLSRFREILPEGVTATEVLSGKQITLSEKLVLPPRAALVLDMVEE